MNENSEKVGEEKRECYKVDVISLFPEMFPGVLGHSLIGKALEQKIWSLNLINLRSYASGKHLSVDDTPAGGGAGMVIRADVSLKAVRDVRKKSANSKVICLSPKGAKLDQKMVRRLANEDGLILLCGRYEGFDERLFELGEVEEVSVGDYILAGGEVAAQLLLEAVIRLLPDVLGDSQSHLDESFEDGLLEYPQYTRPREIEGKNIPDVLLSGDHERVRRWRMEKSLEVTKERRFDLYEKYKSER